jgi:hypothetical protein
MTVLGASLAGLRQVRQLSATNAPRSEQALLRHKPFGEATDSRKRFRRQALRL